MPELPEIETIRRSLQQQVEGCRINAIDIFEKRMISAMAGEKRDFFSSSLWFISDKGNRAICVVILFGNAFWRDEAPFSVGSVRLEDTGLFICFCSDLAGIQKKGLKKSALFCIG